MRDSYGDGIATPGVMVVDAGLQICQPGYRKIKCSQSNRSICISELQDPTEGGGGERS